jgi:colicin import membrane protein
MKTLLTGLAFAAACCSGLAQEPAEVAAERSRIAAVRAEAQARYAAEEKACYVRFAVTDCVNEARARRRDALAVVRQQELALNDAERRRRTAQRLRELEERAAERRQHEAQQRAKAPAEHKERQERESRAADKAAERQAREAAPPRQPAPVQRPAGPAVSPAEAARNAADHNERVQEAQARKERVLKRAAERDKPSVKPLPVPP